MRIVYFCLFMRFIFISVDYIQYLDAYSSLYIEFKYDTSDEGASSMNE